MTYYQNLSFSKIRRFLLTILILIFFISCTKPTIKLNPTSFSLTAEQVHTPEVAQKKYQDMIKHLDERAKLATQKKDSLKYWRWIFGYGTSLLSTSTFAIQLAKGEICIQTAISAATAIFSTAYVFGKFEREYNRWKTLEELSKNEKSTFILYWAAEVENVDKWTDETYTKFYNYIESVVNRLELIQKGK